jgi:hypothetical protein
MAIMNATREEKAASLPVLHLLPTHPLRTLPINIRRRGRSKRRRQPIERGGGHQLGRIAIATPTKKLPTEKKKLQAEK